MSIDELLKDYQGRHSTFQIDNFIIGKQGDRWSRYKQALREISNRYQSLMDLKEDLELFDMARCWRWRSLFGKRARIWKKRRIRSRAAMVENISETERELKRFVWLATKLKRDIGNLDKEKRAVLEADSWRQKSLRMAGIDLLVNGRIGQPTMELILALPVREQTEVLGVLAPDAKPDPFNLIGLNKEVDK